MQNINKLSPYSIAIHEREGDIGVGVVNKKLGRLQIPVRQAFSYGMQHVVILLFSELRL